MTGHLTVDVRMLGSSGIGTYVLNVVPRVVEKLDGVRVTLLGDRRRIESSEWAGAWSTAHLPAAVREVKAPIYSLRQQWEMARAVPRDTDVLWVPHYDIPLLPGPRILAVVHDVLHLARPQFVPGLHRRLYAHGMFRLLRWRAQRVVTVSDFSRHEIHRHVRIPLERIDVVPNGVDEEWFALERPKEDPPSPFFLYVGNVKPHKNLVRLLEAFGRISPSLPHRLLIVGQVEGLRTKDDRVKTLAGRGSGAVEVLGRVSDSRLKQLVRRAQALVLPSLYEGFGLPPLEAMAAGCPVVASNAAAIPEVCGDAALYFDPRDPDDMGAALLKCAESPSLRCELTRRGIERARTFTWGRTAAMTAEVIEEMMR